MSERLIERIGQIAITVHDTERATAFYRDVLGLQHLFSAPPSLAFFDCGGIRLMLAPPEEKAPSAASVLYFPVADIAAAHAQIQERGAAFEGEPHVVHRAPGFELWMAFFRDSEGNLMALMEERRG